MIRKNAKKIIDKIDQKNMKLKVPAAAEEELDLDNLDDFGSKKKRKKKKDRNLDELDDEDKENVGEEGAGDDDG